MWIFHLSAFYPEIFYKKFLLSYAAFPLWICILWGNFAWGLLGSLFYSVLPGNANTWAFSGGLTVVVCPFVAGLLDL